MHLPVTICRLSLELHLGGSKNGRRGGGVHGRETVRVDRQASVRWSSHLFSGGSLRYIQAEDWGSSRLLEDCFQNDLCERVILPGQILYDVKVIHTTQLLERGPPSYAA